MKRTSMTRDEQERWAVSYLAANLSKEEVEDAECSITVQAFADFFAAQWPRTFNKMAFAAKVRAVAAQGTLQGIGSAPVDVKAEVLNGSHLTKRPHQRKSPCPRCGTVHHPGYSCPPKKERSVETFDRMFTLPK